MNYTDIARSLESRLGLQMPPIALAFVEEQPSGIPRTKAVEPSSCAFWRRAETETFYAAAEDHFNCPLGAMVMGFPLPDDQMERLQEEVGLMLDNTYVRESEVEQIPKVAQASTGIVYGPLERFPLEPDATLLWVTPRQAMVMGECCGLIDWAASPTSTLGRPGCAAIPTAMAGGRVAQAFGCTGMRINTGVSEELLLTVIPGEALATINTDLGRIGQVHQRMEAHYNERAASLATTPPAESGG